MPADNLTLSSRAEKNMRAILGGSRGGFGAFFAFAGPAVIASIAYMDPGNYATNIQAGAQFGYALLWVVLAANVTAMVFQALSAKVGIVTGRNLAELSRDHFSFPVVMVMWIVSEVAAMATDLAEFIGGAIGLSLIFHLPLLAGMAITGVLTYAILAFDRNGFRPMELIVGALVAVIGICFLVELVVAPVSWPEAARHAFVPSIPNASALPLCVGIVGATVMPHAIYLHSGLTQHRLKMQDDRERRMLVRFSNREVVLALSFAGLVNMAMVVMASSVFHPAHSDVAEIETAYRTLTPLLGTAAAGVFLVSLIASGISSSVVGTLAGQIIMQGFVGFRIPVWLRRIVTVVPAFVAVGAGIDPTKALILSQVVLSIALPIPMIALLLLARRRDVLGVFATGPAMHAVVTVCTGAVIALNAILLLQAFGVAIPGLPAG